jgi:hypothetical protein
MSEDNPAVPPLPENAQVVRGGIMGSKSLESNAYGSKADPSCGLWALSVWSYPGMEGEEVAEEARRVDPEALPQGKIRVSTAERIRSAGFELVATNQRGHYSLVVPPEPEEPIWDDLREIFDEPIPNPVRR